MTTSRDPAPTFDGLPERDPRRETLHAFAITSVLGGTGSAHAHMLSDYTTWSAAIQCTHDTLLRVCPEEGDW